MNAETKFKSGFVALLGAPNVGKSTIFNTFLEEKVSAVTRKPQTTRRKTIGVLNGDFFQIVFEDTPGIHKAVNKLGERIVGEAMSSFNEADLALFIVAIDDHDLTDDIAAFETISKKSIPVILVANKIDTIKQFDPVVFAKKLNLPENTPVIPVSAKAKTGFNELLTAIIDSLPEGPKYYGDDFFTDQTEPEAVAEIIREQIIDLFDDELPYQTTVHVRNIADAESRNDMMLVDCDIIVTREGQKGIIIGAGGSMIKKLGENSRKQLEDFFEKKVFLKLDVVVRKDWHKDDNFLKRMFTRS